MAMSDEFRFGDRVTVNNPELKSYGKVGQVISWSFGVKSNQRHLVDVMLDDDGVITIKKSNLELLKDISTSNTSNKENSAMKIGDKVRVTNPLLKSHGCVGEITLIYSGDRIGIVDVSLDKGIIITIKKTNLEPLDSESSKGSNDFDINKERKFGMKRGDRVRVTNPNLNSYGCIGRITWAYEYDLVDVLIDKGNSITIKKSNLKLLKDDCESNISNKERKIEMQMGDRVRVTNPNLNSCGSVGKITWNYDSSKDGLVDVLLDKGNSITIKKSNLAPEEPIDRVLSIGDRVRVDNHNLTTYGRVGTITSKVCGLFVVELSHYSVTWNGFITIHPRNLAKVDSDKQSTSPTHHLTLGQLEPKLIKLFKESKTSDLFFDVDDEELARYTVHALRNLLEHNQLT